MDFFELFDLLLDTCQHKLVPRENIPGEESAALPREGHTNPEVTPKGDCPQAKQASSLQELFDLYPSLFDVENFNWPVRHQTKHHIRTKGPPVAQKIRRLSPEKREILKKEIQRLLELGVLIPAESPYHDLPHRMIAKKQPGEYRITGDFRLLNKQTVADKYSISYLLISLGSFLAFKFSPVLTCSSLITKLR